MRKAFVFALIAVFAVSMMGCAMGMAPVSGMLYMDVKGPIGATANSGASKMGTAKAVSYLGWVGMGDASIEAAMKNGGITKVHHVDYHTTNILGLYAETTVKVYGQ